MPPFRVRITKRAQGHLERAQDWWKEHRQGAPELFDREISQAYLRLADAPLTGTGYERRGDHLIRRVFLPGISYHVHYTVDDGARVVLIVAFWHSSRGRRPPLRKR